MMNEWEILIVKDMGPKPHNTGVVYKLLFFLVELVEQIAFSRINCFFFENPSKEQLQQYM